jgi:hypothetical protein
MPSSRWLSRCRRPHSCLRIRKNSSMHHSQCTSSHTFSRRRLVS